MPKIENFDRPTLRYLRQNLETAIKNLAETLGFHAQLGPCRFTSKNATFKLELSLQNTGETKEIIEFKRFAQLLGLQPTDIGKQFAFRDKLYTIVGAKMSARKYPILAQSHTGKVYKFQVTDVLQGLL